MISFKMIIDNIKGTWYRLAKERYKKKITSKKQHKEKIP